MKVVFDICNSAQSGKRWSLLLPLMCLGLVGCGGSNQDAGTASTNVTSFAGVAIDGALARSTVYLDSNNNGTRDPWEDYAFTDNAGYYSYNPITETDYCAANTPASQSIYCLRSSRSYTNVIVRVDGGYDLLTGEPFYGQMSRRVEVSSNEVTDTVVSPLTSLIAELDTQQDQSSVLESLGIDEADLNVNYMDTNGAGDVNTELLNVSLKVHKVVSVLSDRLEDTYTDISDEAGVMNDPSPQIYRNLAQEVLRAETSVVDVLTNSESLLRVLDSAETAIREIYDQRDITPPADLGNVTDSGGLDRVANIASSIPSLVDRLIQVEDQQDVHNDDVVGDARALESLIIKSLDEGDGNDQSIDSAITFFLNESNNDLVDAITDSLGSDLADLSALAENDFSGEDFDDVEEVSNAGVISEDSQVFSLIAGQQLRISDLYLGTPNFLRDIEFEIYFNESSTETEGTFTACAKYIEGALSDGSLGEGNTRGELVEGFWSMLGAGDGDQSYSILMTLEFLGATYQGIVKSVGLEQRGDVEYSMYRFDLAGDYRLGHSLAGLTDTESLPRTNLDCEQRLPSRVGLER